ncbi:hypothetical protein [Tenacibaculum xiamenense]|uniref:hypothetical protein n=1 Tax=Tenacibaculum xiamenense TaxID=1261553 RepID=UPI003893A2D7
MKKIFLFAVMITIFYTVKAQNYTNNDNPVGLEHNVLFNANSRYKVTQSGSAQLNLSIMFDGNFTPSYTSTAPSVANPTVVLIENLPNRHSQRGAWVGWSTRYWQAKRFKIEGFNSYQANQWVTIADYTNQDYAGGAKFIKKVPSGSYTQLRFTFYSAYGTNGRLGVSELFYLHPEATTPYQGLLPGKTQEEMSFPLTNYDFSKAPRTQLGDMSIKLFDDYHTRRPGGSAPDNNNYGTLLSLYGYNNHWESNIYFGASTKKMYFRTSTWSGGTAEGGVIGGFHQWRTLLDSKSDIVSSGLLRVTGSGNHFIENGNIGIGTTNTKGFKLGVNGKIAATEVKVATYGNWADFVFSKEYKLPSLAEVEAHIEEKGHLENIPSAEEVKKDGFFLGEMDAKLLQKIEELTLYTIQQDKELRKQSEEIEELKKLVKALLEKK